MKVAGSNPPNHEDPTNTAIFLDGGLYVGQGLVVSRAGGARQKV